MRLTLSSEPIAEYAKLLDQAETLKDLRAVLQPWDELAGDAVDTVGAWSDADFAEWRQALRSERRGRFMGEARAARFGAVLMPEMLTRIGFFAIEFHVPFIVAVDRLKDVGYVKRSTKNRLRWTGPQVVGATP